MLVWTIALLLIIVSGIVGYYVGVLRMAMSSLALLLTLFFGNALGRLLGFALPPFGLGHPWLVGLLGPILAFVVLQIVFKVSGFALHRWADNYYKYKGSDTERMLFERMSQRVGPCLGVLNGFLYFVLISIFMFSLSYLTVQLSRGSGQDSFAVGAVNSFGKQLESSGFSSALGRYMPNIPHYFDLSDVAGEVFHQPLLQSRLAAYPPLIGLSERREFQEIASDVSVQQLFATGGTVGQLMENPKISALVGNKELYADVENLLKENMQDLKEFLKTGKSPKYDSENILGRWEFNLVATVNENKKLKRMSGLEVNRMRAILSGNLEGAVVLAMIDKQLIVRRPDKAGSVIRRTGDWKSEGGKYVVSFPLADDKKIDISPMIEGNKMIVNMLGYVVVFEK